MNIKELKIKILKSIMSKLSSTDFLNIIQDECSKRKVNRNKIRGGNDVEINKMYLLLTDNFDMREIFILIQDGEYQGFKLYEEEAKRWVDTYKKIFEDDRVKYKRELVDLRDIY